MVHQSSHFGSARYVVIGRKYSSCKPNAVGKADRMNSVGPATIMNSANPIMSQTLISLTTRMPFNPTRQDVVYMAVTRTMVMDCVVRSFGRPHTACSALLICRPRKPIGPIVPTTAMMQAASTRLPIIP